MRTLLLSLLLLVSATTHAQQQKVRFPLWTFHQKNVRIYGVSLGAYSLNENVNTTTNGLRLEAPGIGLLLCFIPRAPWDTAHDGTVQEFPDYKYPERTNGISLSALGAMQYQVNGFTIGGIGQVTWHINGISLAGGMNITQRMNGVQYGTINMCERANGIQIGMDVSTDRLRGIQIGIINSSKNTRGLQIGLWNENEKRKLPSSTGTSGPDYTSIAVSIPREARNSSS